LSNRDRGQSALAGKGGEPPACAGDVSRLDIDMLFETHQLPVSAADLRKRLEPLVRKTQAFKKRIAHKGIWVEPKLLAEIEYRAKSAEGIRQLQRAGISTASAEALLERMLTKIDAMCAERDKLKKELGPVKGRVLGGRSWHV
jgi:hypothetical protein